MVSPQKAASGVVVYAVLTAIGIFFLAPFLWLVLASVNPSANLSVSVPHSASAGNFDAIMTSAETLRPLLNSLLLSGAAALLTMIAATLAAYPLSRYSLRFKKPFMYSILFATGLPVVALMVPVYGLFVQLHLLDSLPGTILFLTATSLPIAIWLTKNFMDGVPLELEEAAWVDGASALRALRSVVLPLMLPGMSVVAIFTFIMAWGNFFVPFILLLSPSKQPAAVSIFQFFTEYGAVAYGQLAAYSILYSAPVIVLYVFMSRKLGGAFSFGGAVKG